MAFSMIFDTCERTTMGLISSRATGPFVDVFCSGTNRPTSDTLELSCVEGVGDLRQDFFIQFCVRLQHVAVEAVRAEALVEVGGLGGGGHIIYGEHGSSVDHLLIFIVITTSGHQVLWSSVDVREVLADRLFYLRALLKYLNIATITVSFNLW
jgi:hypothetical protein